MAPNAGNTNEHRNTQNHRDSLPLSFIMEHDCYDMNHAYTSILSDILQTVPLYPCPVGLSETLLTSQCPETDAH